MRMLQIKQAEVALSAGRLDEARELLADEELRGHRRGQALLDKLIASYMQRCESHIEAGRGEQALADCAAAEELAGGAGEVLELRDRVERKMAGASQRQKHLAGVLGQARRHLADGRLTLAENLLVEAGSSAGSVGDMLRGKLAAHRRGAEALLERLERLLEAGSLIDAASVLAEAKRLHWASAEIDQAEARLWRAAHRAVEDALKSGRLDRAEDLLLGLAAGGETPEPLGELARAMEHCRRGRRWLERGEFRRAAESLRVVQTVVGQRKWLSDAIGQALSAAEAVEALRCGSLALLRGKETPPDAVPAATEPRAGRGAPGPVDSSGRRFCLQVDGAGSFLVVRGPSVRVGPVSDSERPDVALMAGASIGAAEIHRSDGDYILRAQRPVKVNGREVKETALRDGDKIEFSRRCRLRFRQPNAASGTALLVAESARLAQQGATAAVLMDREIVLGPGGSCHVQTSLLDGRAVLIAEGEQLRCRTQLSMTDAEGQATTEIRWDQPVRIGPVGLVMTRAAI